MALMLAITRLPVQQYPRARRSALKDAPLLNVWVDRFSVRTVAPGVSSSIEEGGYEVDTCSANARIVGSSIAANPRSELASGTHSSGAR